MAKQKVDCSELSRVIADIALELGARPEFNTLAKVTAEMRRHLPEISQDEIIRSIAEVRAADKSKREKELPESKELRKALYERDRFRRDINRKIQSLKPKSILATAAEPANLMRAILTSYDFSAFARQGNFILFSRPIHASRVLPSMFKAFASEQFAHEIDAQIRDRPNAPLYDRSGLYLAPLDSAKPLSQQEEAYMSRLADRIPGVAASQRAFATFLNKLRADVFDVLGPSWAKNGELTLEEAQALANYLNVATGRGPLGAAEKAATTLNTFFFSPRYVASRFALMFGQPMWRGTGRTRLMVAKEYGRYLIGLGVFYAITKLLFDDEVEIEANPFDSDFGKLRFGKTRIDPLAGISQNTRFITREGDQLLKTLRGDRRKFKDADGVTILGRFMRSKLAPVFSTSADVLTGEHMDGKKVTMKSVAADVVTPLGMRDIMTMMKEEGIEEGVATGLAGMFGFGVQHHSESSD